MDTSLWYPNFKEYFVEVSPYSRKSKRFWSLSPGSAVFLPLGKTLIAGTLVHALAILFTRALGYIHLMDGQLRSDFFELIGVMMENLPKYQGEEVYWYPGAAMMLDVYTAEHSNMSKFHIDGQSTESSESHVTHDENIEKLVLALCEYLSFESVVVMRPARVYQPFPTNPINNHPIRDINLFSPAPKTPQLHDSDGKSYDFPPLPVSYWEGEPHIYPLASGVEKRTLLASSNVNEILQHFRCD
jgi:hypothetical protein